MLKFAAKRLAYSLVVVLVASFVLFWAVRETFDPLAKVRLSKDPTAIARETRRLGLDQSIVEQYLVWLGGFVRGDWGVSAATSEPVLSMIGRALGTTVQLVIWGLALAVLVAAVVGVYSAVRQYSVGVLGASHLRVVLRHLVPNLAGVVAVNVSLNVAIAIIIESTLSFLGFGVRPPQSSWGNMLSQAAGYVATPQVYLLYFPGLAILLTVLAVSFVGDGLRDALDPRRTR